MHAQQMFEEKRNVQMTPSIFPVKVPNFSQKRSIYQEKKKSHGFFGCVLFCVHTFDLLYRYSLHLVCQTARSFATDILIILCDLVVNAKSSIKFT
jgi:hypothetical protein